AENAAPANGHTFDRQGRPAFEEIDPSIFHEQAVPRLDWLIEGWLLRETVALVTGDGGMGKSMLMMQLCTAMAAVQPWLGIPVQQMRTFAIYCEDDRTQLHIRQARINAHYGCNFLDVGGMARWVSRPGQDNHLVTFRNRDQMVGQKTEFFHF